MSALTLPGDIPGLLRRCSPFTWRGGERGTVVSMRGDDIWLAVDGCVVHKSLDGATSYAGLTLDLEDATGRAHAAWWLAGRLDLRAPFGALWQRAEWKGCWRVVLPHTDGIAIHPHDWAPEWEAITAHLDPNGPRLLEDGSRWVDAEALRLVCLHVAGLS